MPSKIADHIKGLETYTAPERPLSGVDQRVLLQL